MIIAGMRNVSVTTLIANAEGLILNGLLEKSSATTLSIMGKNAGRSSANSLKTCANDSGLLICSAS